jgi:hypothetical protein
MSALTTTRSPRSARRIAAGVAVLGLTVTGVVYEARVADRGVGVVPVEAPAVPRTTGNPAPNSGTLDAQARRKLAELRAQRDADLACAARGGAVRPC